jgi:hypothetical protein
VGSSASAAPGDTVLRGETDDGAKVKLTVGTAGNATKFRLGKTKIRCEEGGTLTNEPGTYRDFVTSDPGEFRIRDKSESSSDGFVFKTKAKVKGVAAEDFETWTGALKLRTRVLEAGERIDTCRLNATWEAS